MEKRLRFVVRPLEGEKMAVLCREFDISRKTGYKIFSRYQHSGLEGLADRSRRPYRPANRMPMQIEAPIVQLKREHPRWGAPRIREKIRRRLNDLPHLPANSSARAVLDRNGLAARGGERRAARYKAQGTTLSRPTAPNDLRCADYKGEFMRADRRYCYPLAISDFASRFLVSCEAQASTEMRSAFTVFEHALQGLRPAGLDPHRQRHPLRPQQRLLRPHEALGVVVAPQHRPGACSPRPPPGERPP